VHNSLCSFCPFVGYSDSSASLMGIDAQYTRSRKVCSMASLCDPPRLRFFLSRLSSETTCLVYPFNTSLSNRLLHFAVCCSWQYRALSRSPPECLIQRADVRRRIDRSSCLDRRDIFAESAGSIERIISKLTHKLVPPAFASCGQAKEYGKVTKSAMRVQSSRH